jgi:hypothetical protein
LNFSSSRNCKIRKTSSRLREDILNAPFCIQNAEIPPPVALDLPATTTFSKKNEKKNPKTRPKLGI